MTFDVFEADTSIKLFKHSAAAETTYLKSQYSNDSFTNISALSPEPELAASRLSTPSADVFDEHVTVWETIIQNMSDKEMVYQFMKFIFDSIKSVLSAL